MPGMTGAQVAYGKDTAGSTHHYDIGKGDNEVLM